MLTRVRWADSGPVLAVSRQGVGCLAVEPSNFATVGEMAQWLKALSAFPKVLSSIASNHMVAHNHLY